jgi:hypothetical protein
VFHLEISCSSSVSNTNIWAPQEVSFGADFQQEGNNILAKIDPIKQARGQRVVGQSDLWSREESQWP